MMMLQKKDILTLYWQGSSIKSIIFNVICSNKFSSRKAHDFVYMTIYDSIKKGAGNSSEQIQQS